MSEATASSALDTDNQLTTEKLDANEAGSAREDDVRRISDDNEEQTAKGNEDDEFFGTIEDESWDGLVETTYNFHLQLAPSISCSVCFHVTQFHARQDCGHVLCFSCIQQSFSCFNHCSLCQAQLVARADKIEAVPGSETMEVSSVHAEQDGHLPVHLKLPYCGLTYQLSKITV